MHWTFVSQQKINIIKYYVWIIMLIVVLSYM